MKKSTKTSSKRPGLRSQAKLEAKRDKTWDSLRLEGEEASSVELPVSSKSSTSHTSRPSTLSSRGMVNLVRDFLDTQQAREERYL